MTGLPRALTRKIVQIEPCLGSDATGPLYGPAREVRAYVESVSRSMRSPDGRIAVGTVAIWVPLDHTISPEDRVTYRDQRRDVLAVEQYDSGFGTPDHTKITVQ